MFDEPRDLMGQSARGMRQFTACVHRSFPEKSEYHTLQFLLEIKSRPDHEADDAGEKDAKDIGNMKNEGEKPARKTGKAQTMTV